MSGFPIIIDVLGNDTDPEGDPLSVESVEQPEQGTVTSTGAFVIYTPPQDYVGVERFTYTASDAIGGSSTATVTVTVEDANISGDAVVTPTVVSLVNGGSASYSIALGSEPSAPVTITIISDGRLVAEPDQLVFDSTNWNQLQTVTVRLAEVTVADDEPAATQESTVYHLAQSNDRRYNNLGLPAVTVQIGEMRHLIFLPAINKQ